MPYFVISTDEDGDVYLHAMDKEKLLKEFTPDEDGYAERNADEVRVEIEPFQNLQAQAGMFIIKGELVVPKPKEKVTTYELV